MKQKAQQVLAKTLTLIIAGVASASFAAAATAAETGAGITPNVDAGSSTPPPDAARPDGTADTSMRTPGSDDQLKNGAAPGTGHATKARKTRSSKMKPATEGEPEAAKLYR